MMKFPNRTTLSLLAVATLMLAACSGTRTTELNTSSPSDDFQFGDSEEESKTSGPRNAPQFGTVAVVDPLGDAIPGLGIDGPNVERDETLSIYQAYLRELIMADCMSDQGFSYAADPQYPREFAQAVANTLPLIADVERPMTGQRFDSAKPTIVDREGDIEAVAIDWNDATRWNADALKAYIGDRQGDDYMLALYGETLEDMERQGNPDSDPDTFAQGGCYGKAWNQIPGVWAIKSQVRDAQHSILTVPKERALRECVSPYGLDARTPGDIEVLLLDPSGKLSDSERVEIGDAVEKCTRAWDEAGQMAKESKEFLIFVQQQIAKHKPFIEEQRELLNQARSDRAFAGFLRAAFESKGGVEFGDPPIPPLEPSDEAPLQVPLDVPDVERNPDAAPPQTPPPEDFLAALPQVLNINWGPGMPDTFPNIEIFWDGESLGAEAAPAGAEMRASDSQVLFDCGDYVLRLSGPFVSGDPNPSYGPVPHALQTHLLDAYGGQCKIR